MTTIVTRAGKGSSLTWTEGDANFTNLNNDKVEVSTLAGSTGSDDVGYIQSGSGAVARTVQDALRERLVSVMDFGATGDGSTDDAAAIQAAVDSLGTGGGTIFFPKPASSYIIGTGIDLSGLSNLYFLGCGGIEWQTGNSTQIKAKNTLTGGMFIVDEANATRSGGFTFERLHLNGNNQNVDGFYIHGDSPSNIQNRFIEFTECTFQGMRNGIWLGNYTAETPDLTYILGVNLFRVFLLDCVYPVVADAGALDGLTLDQVWIVTPNDRTIRAIQVLTGGTTLTCQNVWFALGAAATYGIYCAITTAMTVRDSSFEGNAGTETFVSVYQPSTGGASLSGIIIDNVRIQSVAGASAIDVSNAAGMEIRSSTVDGNIVVGSSTKVMADNVIFTSGAYTGTTANVYINGEASGTWTPTITFDTPGNLSVVYSVRVGTWSKVGRQVTAWFELVTSSFTHTTASGNLVISGLPYQNVASRQTSGAVGAYGGITAAGAQHLGTLAVASGTSCNIFKSGSGVAASAVAATDMPTGGTVLLYGQVSYRTDTL